MDSTHAPRSSYKTPPPVIEPGHTFESVTSKITSVVLTKYQPFAWVVTLGDRASLFLNLLLVSVGYLFLKGIGIWGNNVPVGWAFDIINFVWWIGIGHAGTLISAILLLLKQDWRTSINRFAEAMTLFAVACALMFPLIHTGRPWLAAYWLFPYPNGMDIWPQFRSPLIWDVFAVSTYGTVSALFWYTGLIPDLATMRDRAKNKITRYIYGALALGWRGSARHWQRYENAYLLLAGMSTPLVLSVHTVVSFDFSVGIIPGWHTTIFPPYFVAGAIYAGFAMVLTLAIPLRRMFGFEDFITMRHLENMAKVTLVTGLIVVYGYAMEIFFGYYSANQYQKFMIHNRMFGPVRLVVLDADLLQRHRAADAVDQEPAHQHDLALHHVARRQRRHVAGALRDHRHVAAPRLPALVVGDVLPDVLGFLDLLRHDRAVRDADVPVRPGAADDLDLRGADAAARGEGERRGADTRGPCASEPSHEQKPPTGSWRSSTMRTRSTRRPGAPTPKATGRWTRIRRSRSSRCGKRWTSTIARCRSSCSAAASSACSPASGCATGCRRSRIR